MENQNQHTGIAPPDAKTKFGKMTVEDLKDALRNATIPARLQTTKEKLAELAPELKKQLARGHTVVSMAAALQAHGMQVSARTIGKMLRTTKSPKMPQSQTSTPVCKQCTLNCIHDKNNEWFCPRCRSPAEQQKPPTLQEAELQQRERQRGG